MLDKALKLGTRLAYPFTRGRYARSWPIEGTMEHLGKGETLYWCFKRFYRPIGLPEPGRGIEARFRPLPAATVVSGEGYPRFEPPPVSRGLKVDSRARVVCAGDILATRAAVEADTTHLLDDLTGFLAHADLVCANLESPVVPSRPFAGLPPRSLLAPLHLNHSAAFARGLLGNPVNLVSLANNHALDQGPDGLIATMDFLDDIGCAYVGCARAAAERDAPLITELAGIRVAHIAWTFSLSNKQLPPGYEHLVDYLRLNLRFVELGPLRAQVRVARAAGADIVIAHLHWGLEFEAYPNHALIENAHRIIDAGVDVIVGNHPHHVQPWEWYRSAVRDGAGDADADGAGGAGADGAGGAPDGAGADGGGAGEGDAPAGTGAGDVGGAPDGAGADGTDGARTGLIIYAQGDFASFQRDMPTATWLSALACIELAKGRDEAGREHAWVSGLRVMPVFPFAVHDGRRCVELRMLDLTRLARDGFDCHLDGYGVHHRRRARKLWELAARVRLRDGAEPLPAAPHDPSRQRLP